MITNVNDSKTQSDYNFIEVKKFIGLGIVNILSVNPNNATLRKYGWSISEDAPEPQYATTDKDGKKTARVRFLVRVENHDDKPILAMDFWVRPEVRTSSNSGEVCCQVIDDYGRTAYVTKQQYDKKEIPLSRNGNPIKICNKYRMCHSGEADLINFLRMYLNVTPFEVYDNNLKAYVETKKPGILTFDNWDRICSGDVKEICEYVAKKPDNRVGVDFGVRTTSENKSYQMFLTSDFFEPTVYLSPSTGKYQKVENRINNYLSYRNSGDVVLEFSAEPIKEWKVTATDVRDNSVAPSTDEDMPADLDTMSSEIFDSPIDTDPF